MDSEKRKSDVPIPENLQDVLNDAQRKALPGLNFAGWKPYFLRQPLFQPAVLVVQNPEDGRIGVMGEDGRIQDGIKVRDEKSQARSPRKVPALME